MSQAVMVENFGERLRGLRQRAGLSQVEVGRPKYSGSYVSHLESGRRRPTDDVVIYLADRLGVERDFLLETDQVSYTTGSAGLDLLELQSTIRDAESNGDQHLVVERSKEAAELALAERRADVWWDAVMCRMRALMKLNNNDEAIALGYELLRHHITMESHRLQAQVLTAMARCYRPGGQLDQSLELSEQAIDAARAGGDDLPEGLVLALLEHSSSQLSAGGALAAAQSLAELRKLRPRITSPQILGLTAWVLGNAAFMSGDTELGLEEHEIATSLIRAEVDIQSWGRFRLASARMRLEVGANAGVDRLLSDAANALSLAGNAGDLANLEIVRALHLAATGDYRAAVTKFDRILHTAEDLSQQAAGEIHELRYRSLLALGEAREAREALKQAASEFEAAHAWGRAVASWRLCAELNVGE